VIFFCRMKSSNRAIAGSFRYFKKFSFFIRRKKRKKERESEIMEKIH
jgi:hypothetical protein